MKQAIINKPPCVNRPAQYRVGNTGTRTFDTYHRYFYFQYHQHSSQSKIFQNLSFTSLGLPLK